jgi:hypothetical protein
MNAKRRTKRFDDATLAVIEVDHNAGELTLNAIGKKYGCSGAYICKLARELGWPRRRPASAGATKTTASADGAVSAAPAKKKRPPDVRVMIKRRMCKVINEKLKEMEQGMKTGDMSAADVERNTKVVTSMIGSLQKVATPGEDKVGDAQSTNAGAKDDVERLQREIIERFERIQRRREIEGGSR